MPEGDTPRRGLIDTSVVIELERVDPKELPAELAIAAVTLAELAAGPHATTDVAERARRQDRLQRTESTFGRSRSMRPRHVPSDGYTRPWGAPAARHEAGVRSTS